MSIKIGLQGRTAASKSSPVLQLKVKAGLQEHPNTNSTTCNYKNLHHPEQAVLWHKDCLNWVSLQFPTHTSSGDQWSGTSHPITAAPAPQNRPRSNTVCTQVPGSAVAESQWGCTHRAKHRHPDTRKTRQETSQGWKKAEAAE